MYTVQVPCKILIMDSKVLKFVFAVSQFVYYIKVYSVRLVT